MWAPKCFGILWGYRAPLACKLLLLQKHPLPANWDLEGARRLFLQPEVADPGQITLEWHDPDPEGLVQFLAREKHMKSVLHCLDGGQAGWPSMGRSPVCDEFGGVSIHCVAAPNLTPQLAASVLKPAAE